jgi:hypothetical protein
MYSAYELYIATTTSATKRTPNQESKSTASESATFVSEEQSTSDYEEPKIIGAYYEEQPASKSERQKSTKASVDQTKSDDLVEAEALCARFKETLSQEDAKVHFVGAWYFFFS